MTEPKGVLVYIEASEGKITSVSHEALGIGRKLADELGEELCATLIGDGSPAPEAISLGADKVFVADGSVLTEYEADSCAPVMEKVATQASPRIVIFGQTAAGRDLAPRMAFRLNSAAALDCVELAIDPASKNLLATGPVYGGNAMATVAIEATPQIVTIRAKAFPAAQADTARKGEIVNIDAGLDASTVRTKVLERIKGETEGLKLEDAPVVVAGGRGIGGPDGFKQLEELAHLLKGTLGASRPPCDNGWVSEFLQIGITGKIIAPDIYFAVGLSGSSQHLSGCSGSKNIIAINKDPEANIFNAANYGIVGDWKKIIPALTEKIKELTTS